MATVDVIKDREFLREVIERAQEHVRRDRAGLPTRPELAALAHAAALAILCRGRGPFAAAEALATMEYFLFLSAVEGGIERVEVAFPVRLERREVSGVHLCDRCKAGVRRVAAREVASFDLCPACSAGVDARESGNVRGENPPPPSDGAGS